MEVDSFYARESMSADSSLDLNLQLLVHAGIVANSRYFVPSAALYELPSLVLSKNEAYDPQNAVQYAATSTPKPSFEKTEPAQPFFASPPAPQPETPDGRRHALKMLASEIGECNLCGELYSHADPNCVLELVPSTPRSHSWKWPRRSVGLGKPIRSLTRAGHRKHLSSICDENINRPALKPLPYPADECNSPTSSNSWSTLIALNGIYQSIY